MLVRRSQLSSRLPYLNDDANEDIALVFMLHTDSPPPIFEAEHPIPRTTNALSILRQNEPISLVLLEHLGLLPAHNRQLLILRLEQANPNRQV